MDTQLKTQLSRTWPVFFARYGSFTEVQWRAMPVILAGWDTLITAATAAGKTEAALVRFWSGTSLAGRVPGCASCTSARRARCSAICLGGSSPPYAP